MFNRIVELSEHFFAKGGRLSRMKINFRFSQDKQSKQDKLVFLAYEL